MTLLKPSTWFNSRSKRALAGQSLTARQSAAQGPYTTMFADMLPREINPYLYEGLRETIPIIDGAIDRLCTLDGILRVETESTKLDNLIAEFMEGVRVNDLDHGMQTFYKIAANEKYEQGFVIGGYDVGARREGVTRLRVADSKGVFFRRIDGVLRVWYAPPAPKRSNGDGVDKMQRALRNNYASYSFSAQTMQHLGLRELDLSTVFYQAIDVESDNPYGVSKLRSLEFSGKTLLTIANAIQQTWERFGDPIFDLTYKTSARISPEELETRRVKLSKNLAAALEAKRGGNAVDFVNAVGRDDDLILKVVGHDNQTLEIETPARHLLEQIVAKWGVPPWMFGIVWGTSERLSDRQSDMAIQDTKTRFANARGGLEKIIATDLRAKGITWKRGDWQLIQELPNLKSEMETAQAEFLRAQTQLMLSGGGGGRFGSPLTSIEADPAKHAAQDETFYGIPGVLRWARELNKSVHHKAEDYVEDGTALMRLEQRAAGGLLGAWDTLASATYTALGLTRQTAKASEVAFVFDAALMLEELNKHRARFIEVAGGDDSSLAGAAFDAWTRGVANGAVEFDSDAVTAEVLKRQRAALQTRGLELVRNGSVRGYQDEVVAALVNGDYDGQNPKDVARALAARFDAGTYNWERLARSEIGHAQVLGKLDQYEAQGIDSYDWIRAGGACAICIELEAGSPYKVGGGPLPVSDSHPNCRCTVAAVV